MSQATLSLPKRQQMPEGVVNVLMLVIFRHIVKINAELVQDHVMISARAMRIVVGLHVFPAKNRLKDQVPR